MGAATQMIGGGALMLAIAPAIGERIPAGPIGWQPIVALVYLTLLGSIVAFSAYSHLLRHARPSVAMSYAYVNPVIAVMLGAALGGEAIGAEVLIATAMIAGAVFLLLRTRTPASRP
jgi:drug/metabolite transporter (DMT)-like permease